MPANFAPPTPPATSPEAAAHPPPPLVLLVEGNIEYADSAALLLRNAGYNILHFSSPAELLVAPSLNNAACILLDQLIGGLPNGLELIELFARRGDAMPPILASSTRTRTANTAGGPLARPYSPAELLPALATAIARTPHSQAAEASPLARLTQRESAVLNCLVAGANNKQIATQLGISVRTAEVHRASLMARLGVQNITELFRLAARLGLLQ